MPIIPGSGSKSGGSGAFFLSHASSKKLTFQSGQEIEIIPPSTDPNLRKYWIYNAGQTTVYLRGRAIESQDFVDFPLLPGGIFSDLDNGGPASVWYGISSEDGAILNVHIKSQYATSSPTTTNQNWVEPAMADWQPTGLGENAIFFMKYTGDNSQSVPVTVQVNASARAIFFASSSLGNNFSEASEDNADFTREQLQLDQGSQGTYEWHYDEYPFLMAIDIIGAYDDILLYEMEVDMSSGFPVISLLQRISVYY